MSIDVAPRAQLDIELFAEEIRDASGARAAERFADRLQSTLTTLERFPGFGEVVDPPYPKYPGMRKYPIRKQPHHIVYYFPADDGISVARVIHSSRDVDAIFT